jgi:hypothetical protein
MARCYRWLPGGGEELLLDDVPITGGTLTLDASDPVRRRLSLQLGDAPVPQTYLDPLVPFGQYLKLWVTIDRSDGTWFPWLKQGEYPIQSYVFERPSRAATVEAVDYSGRVDEYLYLAKRNYAGATVAGAIKSMVDDALPNRVASTDPSNIWDTATTTKVLNYAVTPGGGRWQAAVELAARKGAECFFNWNGDLVIRRALSDADDITGPSNGPDIGTNTNPVLRISDGPAGNMVAMTATVTRDGGCNRVELILNPTATQRGKAKKPPPPEYTTRHVHAEVTDGPAKWGDVFGYLPIVISADVFKTTPAVLNQYQGRANGIKKRRRGVVRYIDLDVVGAYWAEPDDHVQLTWKEDTPGVTRTEDHYVAAVTFDLSGQAPTRVTTRQLAVEDPGSFT